MGDDQAILLDLRDIQAHVEPRDGDGVRELVLVVGDGHTRVEFTGGHAGSSGAAVFGAQRLANAALDFAVGLALLSMPQEPGAG